MSSAERPPGKRGPRRQPKARAHRAPTTYGCYAKNHRAIVREKVDYDYLARPGMDTPDPTRGGLTPRQWLAKFSDEWASAKFGDDPLFDDADIRRELYRSNNAVNRDIFSLARARRMLDRVDVSKRSGAQAHRRAYVLPDADGDDRREEAFVSLDSSVHPVPFEMEATPKFHGDADYKSAREEFRRAVDAKDRSGMDKWGRVLMDIAMRDVDGDTGGSDDDGT